MPSTFVGPGSLGELAARDRFGDRIHLALACCMLLTLPVNGRVAGVLLAPLIVWSLIRTVCWPKYLPSAPKVVMIPALVWIGFLAASSLWSPDFRVAGLRLWQQWPVTLVPILWPILAHWRILLGCILAGAIVQATFHSIAIVITGFHIDTIGFGGLGEHPRRLAVWYAATAVGILALLLNRQLRAQTWLLALALLMVPILLSHSRAALIALILGSVGVIIVAGLRRGMSRRNLRIALAFFALMGACFLAFGDSMSVGLETAWRRTTATVVTDHPEDIRLAWWRSCARQWQTRPLLGFGLGGADEALATDAIFLEETANDPLMVSARTWHHPHSSYFQVLVEGGVVGVAVFAWLLGTLLITAWKHSREHDTGAVAFGVLVVWITAAATDEWYLVGHLLSMLWIAAVLAPFDPMTSLESMSEVPPK